MNNNEYNIYMQNNQDMNYNHYNPENNNLATIENYDLIDLSGHSSNQCDFLTPEENVQTEPRYNKVIRTKGARKIIIDQRGTSYESAPYEITEQERNNTSHVRNDQTEPFHDVASFDITNDEIVSERVETQDVVAFDSQNLNDSSSTGVEDNENYSALDHSTLSKLEKISDINKAILRSMLRNLSAVKWSPGQAYNDIYIFKKSILNPKVLQFLVSSVLEIVRNGLIIPQSKSITDKSTQTDICFKEPPVLRNNYTQTPTESVPRAKINMRSNEMYQNKDLNKEHNGRHFHNLQVSNQETSICNQQEPFYDNQNVFSQLNTEMIYHGQTTTTSRNNLQAPMMHYGMPQTTNPIYNAPIQRMESANNGGQTMMQYGIPHADNTMMQNPERGITGMQPVTQYGIPHHEHSVIQRTDVSRNKMQTMTCPRTCHHANATATATVPPTYYNRRKWNVQRNEIPRGNQPTVMQTGPHVIQPSQMRGRVSRSRSYYVNPTNPPCPTRSQWQTSAYQDQYRIN